MNKDTLTNLININSQNYEKMKHIVWENFQMIDRFIHDEQKKLAKHHHFNTRKECEEPMSDNWNPFDSFSCDEQ